MKIAIAQLNPIVGDIDGNLKKAMLAFSESSSEADLIVFPELFLTGYPPRDLLEKPEFVKNVQEAVQNLVKYSQRHSKTGVLFGAPVPTLKKSGNRLYNAAILAFRGKVLGTAKKTLLPNYDVFDETRYFEPSPDRRVFSFKGRKIGVTICEDMWSDPELLPEKRYEVDPIKELAKKGAEILINLSASPFCAGKEERRHKLVSNHSKKYELPLVFVNQVGSNDELIFDGRSFAVDGKGRVLSVLPSFEELVETIDVFASGKTVSYAHEDRVETIYKALIIGIRDYMRKCGFKTAVIGLSGGIDSAVMCVLAKEAMGAQNVLGITMPSGYSAPESEEYSRVLANKLGVRFEVISISGIYAKYLETLGKELGEPGTKDVEVYLQNIQARIRGNILMAFSNKFGHLLLSTGNKSELAVGYCTLYGDMAGGLAALSDVPKTTVYELARYINRNGEIIQQEIIDRVPTAELKPNQTDQDTLPKYDILDRILYLYLEEARSEIGITREGFDPKVVRWVIDAVNKNEYKRRQAAPCLRVTSKAFGVGRRMPIAAKY